MISTVVITIAHINVRNAMTIATGELPITIIYRKKNPWLLVT